MTEKETPKQPEGTVRTGSGGNNARPQSSSSTKLYVVDLRIFVLTVSLAMACSFWVGMNMIPFEMRDEAVSVAQSNVIVAGNQDNDHPAYHDLPTTVRSTETAGGTSPSISQANESAVEEKEAEVEDKEEEHLPAGQHLLVDLKGVSSSFLNSEERLSQAMVDTVQESGLTMLSYHCHKLLPSGISCVGVLLESHIAFHTWPEEGVITLDLFTCGSQPLLPVIPMIERLFGVPRERDELSETEKSDEKESQIQVRWSHELRGFRSPEETRRNYLADSSDLSLWVLSPLEMHSKKQIYGGMTKFQRVDIWDITEYTDSASYEDILKHNITENDPRLRDPEWATPDRLLFLDGTLQSITSSERVYHEAMVHPAMFAHSNPKHVAILGGGEGATLREVLKHSTVESATMVELDEELVKIAREFMPTFSDCSDLLGRADYCLDDELADVYYDDGRQWFMERYHDNVTASNVPSKLFDVILMDALDPEDDTEISDLLYSDEAFITSLINALSEEGVLAIQVGTAATIDDPRPDKGTYANREAFFNKLEENTNVEALLIYEEANCGFFEPHSFLIVCKSASCRSRWYARSDQVDYEIYDRIVRTHSKERALTYYDGMTQRSYQWPKKGWEAVYCRREPMPFECAYRHLDPKAEVHEFLLPSSDEENNAGYDESQSSFRYEATKKEDGTTSTYVFATVNIPKGSYVMADHMARSLIVTRRNLEGLEKNVAVSGTGRVAVIEDLLKFFESYAHPSAMEGSGEYFVELGATALVRRVANEAEANIGKWVPNHPSGRRPKYSPVYERHRMSFDVFLVATKDIAEGEEILMYQNMW